MFLFLLWLEAIRIIPALLLLLHLHLILLVLLRRHLLWHPHHRGRAHPAGQDVLRRHGVVVDAVHLLHRHPLHLCLLLHLRLLHLRLLHLCLLHLLHLLLLLLRELRLLRADGLLRCGAGRQSLLELIALRLSGEGKVLALPLEHFQLVLQPGVELDALAQVRLDGRERVARKEQLVDLLCAELGVRVAVDLLRGGEVVVGGDELLGELLLLRQQRVRPLPERGVLLERRLNGGLDVLAADELLGDVVAVAGLGDLGFQLLLLPREPVKLFETLAHRHDLRDVRGGRRAGQASLELCGVHQPLDAAGDGGELGGDDHIGLLRRLEVRFELVPLLAHPDGQDVRRGARPHRPEARHALVVRRLLVVQGLDRVRVDARVLRRQVLQQLEHGRQALRAVLLLHELDLVQEDLRQPLPGGLECGGQPELLQQLRELLGRRVERGGDRPGGCGGAVLVLRRSLQHAGGDQEPERALLGELERHFLGHHLALELRQLLDPRDGHERELLVLGVGLGDGLLRLHQELVELGLERLADLELLQRLLVALECLARALAACNTVAILELCFQLGGVGQVCFRLRNRGEDVARLHVRFGDVCERAGDAYRLIEQLARSHGKHCK